MDDSILMAYQGLQTTAGILGSYASAVTSYKNNRRLMAYQAELNQQAIDKQNEYNLPSNQMARLNAAGLNPNLVYGNGSVVGNTTEASKTGLGHAETPRYEQVLMQNNLAMQKAQIANLEADTNLKNENAKTQDSVRERNTQEAEYKKYFTTWNYATWDLREYTMNLDKAIKQRQYGLIGYYMANLRSIIEQRDQVTEQTIMTMAQGREMQLKEFELRKEDLAQQWKHWKNQDAIGFKNASALMISALAAQMQASAAGENADTNRFNASTQRKYYELAKSRFDKMSDLEQSKLYQEVLNKISYREGYLNYLAPYMEGRIDLIDTQSAVNRQRLQNFQQDYDFGVPGMALDFLNFGNKFSK